MAVIVLIHYVGLDENVSFSSYVVSSLWSSVTSAHRFEAIDDIDWVLEVADLAIKSVQSDTLTLPNDYVKHTRMDLFRRVNTFQCLDLSRHRFRTHYYKTLKLKQFSSSSRPIFREMQERYSSISIFVLLFLFDKCKYAENKNCHKLLTNKSLILDISCQWYSANNQKSFNSLCTKEVGKGCRDVPCAEFNQGNALLNNFHFLLFILSELTEQFRETATL